MNGKIPRPGYNKQGFSPEAIFVDEGNPSRKATHYELLEDFGLLRCQDDSEDETKALGFASLPVIQNPNSSPRTKEPITTPAEISTASAIATAINSAPTTLSTIINAATQALSAAQSLITESVQYAFHDEDEHKEKEQVGEPSWLHSSFGGEIRSL